MKLLLTGFEPFDNESVNPSGEAVLALKNVPENTELRRVVLPVAFGAACAKLREEIRAFRPDAVLMCGLAASRSGVTLERIAVNLADARIPDNEGNQPVDETLHADGDTAYFATLPVRRIVAALRDQGIPAEISESAGLYVCNSVFYEASYLAQHEFPGMRAGFLHLPCLPEQAERYGDSAGPLSLDKDILAIETALAVIAETSREACAGHEASS